MELANLVRPEFVILVLFLSGLGSVLKYRTPVDNKLIPAVLFGTAFLIGASSGYVNATEYRWYEALVTGGLVNGGTATAIAVFGWDAFHGVYKKGAMYKKDKGGGE